MERDAGSYVFPDNKHIPLYPPSIPTRQMDEAGSMISRLPRPVMWEFCHRRHKGGRLKLTQHHRAHPANEGRCSRPVPVGQTGALTAIRRACARRPMPPISEGGAAAKTVAAFFRLFFRVLSSHFPSWAAAPSELETRAATFVGQRTSNRFGPRRKGPPRPAKHLDDRALTGHRPRPSPQKSVWLSRTASARWAPGA